MNVELFVLTLTVVVGLIQLLLATSASTFQRGTQWNLSSRDEPQPPLTGRAGRLSRSFENFKETYPFFLALVFLITATLRGGFLSQLGAWIYLGARVISTRAFRLQGALPKLLT